ncbi:MAG TPA: endonuclease III [Bacteroidota bacterium]|nr:endonuclease III [Bacteroidota bacterium]
MSVRSGKSQKRIAPAVSKASAILKQFKRDYDVSKIGLEASSPLELVVATILSAQCTDVRVNMVTPTLFKRYRSASDYANAKPKELEGIIRSTGFYHAKAKSIIGMAKGLIERFGGVVPDTLDQLTTLPGVGRKTANVVLGKAFGKTEGIVVDTHVKRLSFRLEFTKHTDPEKIEQDLMKLFPKKDWIGISNCLIWHGRMVCNARAPKCDECHVSSLCPSAHLFMEKNSSPAK